ncbi:MAG: glycosyltransferase 87 family protein [Oscillospiraceae bacterium]
MKLRSSLPDCPWYFSLPCTLSGAVLLVLIVIGAQFLELGTPAARAAVGLVLLLAAALALCLLRREGCPGMSLLLLVLPIAAGLYLRLLCLDRQTHDYQTFLAQWVAYFRDNGGFSAIKEPLGDYNVPYLYFLAAISYLPVPDLYLIKLFSVLCDVLLAWGGLRLTRQFCREGSPAPLVCFTLLLLLPTVILNGACWGQCDTLYAALTLLALSCALEGKPKTSVLLLAVAFSFKLQTVFLIPLWCAFWFTGRVKFRHLLLFPAGYALTILPALLLGKPLGDILGVYLNQMGEYSSLSLNAPSMFGFLPYKAQVNTVLASRLGIVAAFVLVLVVLGLLFRRRKQVTPELLLTAAVVLAIGIPFLLPHMHDRYFMLAGVITLVWACTNWMRFPIALLTELSSLSCYSIYLRSRYTFILYWSGQYFVMAVEALLMLCALVGSMMIFFRQLKDA